MILKFKTHELHINPNYQKGVVVDKISHINPYDFRQIHRHNYYEILFFSEGNGGEQIIDFQNYHIKRNSVYIIKPNQIHLLKNKTDENGISIQFTEEFLKIHFSFIVEIELLQKATELVLNDIRCTQLLSLTESALTNFRNESALSHKKVIHCIGLILIEILEEILQESTVKNIIHNSISQCFTSMVQREIRSIRNVQEYAQLLNISTNKLNNEIRNSLGKSPKEVIQEHLLLEIKRLLVVNELSHKEISYYLNFDSQNSYNRFISTQTNMTPTELKIHLNEFHK